MHLDASIPGHARRALCGWIEVDVETDVSRVTCKACLVRMADKRGVSAPAGRKAGKAAASAAEVALELAAAFRATLAPKAAPPPLVTPALWSSSCKGGEHRRCGECEICLWEREADLWNAVSPWNREHAVARPEGAPRWGSLGAALSAFAEWERHDRFAPSALGGILDRVRRGISGEAGGVKGEDPLLRRAGELVRIRQALDMAYPDGAHAIDAGTLKTLLLVRTPGVVKQLPTYEALSALLGVAVGELRALVRAGRKRVTEELASRGLIPVPHAQVRTIGAASMRAEVAA